MYTAETLLKYLRLAYADEDDDHTFAGQHNSHMCQRGNKCLCSSHFISAFCSFGIRHMCTDIWTLVRSFFVWFRGLHSTGLHMCRGGNNRWCRSHYIFTFQTLEFSLMLTDIRVLELCFSVWFCGLRRSGLHSYRYGNYWLCRYHFILGFGIFRICHMRTHF